MDWRKALGWTLICWPFVGIFAAVVAKLGWVALAKQVVFMGPFGATIFGVGWGIKLISENRS